MTSFRQCGVESGDSAYPPYYVYLFDTVDKGAASYLRHFMRQCRRHDQFWGGAVKQQLIIMLQMQNAMNQKVHPEWATQRFEWYRAIWIECAELMDHYGWKWWKRQAPERDQVVLELIDIWHFGLSDLLQSGATPEQLADDILSEMDFSTPQKPFLSLVEDFACEVLANRRFSIALFTPMLTSAEVDFEHLYRSYVGKNVLNFFRQDHGYQEGNYRKQWQGREDNEHLVEIVSTLDSASPDYQTRLYSALEERYQQSSSQA